MCSKRLTNLTFAPISITIKPTNFPIKPTDIAIKPTDIAIKPKNIAVASKNIFKPITHINLTRINGKTKCHPFKAAPCRLSHNKKPLKGHIIVPPVSQALNQSAQRQRGPHLTAIRQDARAVNSLQKLITFSRRAFQGIKPAIGEDVKTGKRTAT